MASPSLSEEEIDGLSLREAFRKAQEHGIPTEGLRKRKEIIFKLKSKLVSDRRPRECVIASLDTVAAEDHDLRKELYNIYSEVVNTLENQLKEEDENYSLTEQLEKHQYPDYIKTLKREKGRLSGNTSRCPILVLGETGAGKSSFINLLLGDEVLPTQVLSNTNVICEIQHSNSEEHWALMYAKADDDECVERISSKNKTEFIRDLANHIQRSDEPDTRQKYERAKIYLPCDILKTGLVIVDSPGIGDTPEMKKLVLDYIIEACSFIYIINSANAGGVQEDRVQELISEVVRKAFKDQMDYRPECALFVCNKWDRVPLAERLEVYEDTRRKLEGPTGWPNCSQKQIFCFSTLEASYVQKEGFVIGQFSRLLEEIHRLIPKSREILLIKSTRFLSTFLDKCLFCINTRLPREGMTEEENKISIEEEKAKFMQLKGKIKDFFKTQKKALKCKIFHIADDLSKYLSKNETIAEICDVSKYEKALKIETWKEAMVVVRSELYTQITAEIQKWEKKTNVLDKASIEIANEFRTEFPNFSAMISQTERKFQDGRSKRVLDEQDEPFIPLSVSRRFETLDMSFKVLLGVGLAPVFLLGAIFRLPVYGFVELKRKITQITLQSTFENKNKQQQEIAIRKYAESILQSVVDPINLGPLMVKEVEPLFEYLRGQKLSLIKQIEADVKTIEEAENDMVEANAFKVKYAPVQSRLNNHKGKAVYFLHMKMSIPHSKTCMSVSEFTENRKISDGCLSYVMQATYTGDKKAGFPKQVSVHHSKIQIQASNIIQFMEEDTAYRFSKMLKTYGCIKSSNGIWQVMEPMSSSLRFHLHTRTVPPLEKFRQLSRLMEQIVSGLQYLHERKYVHIDLSLDTVLVNMVGKVKLVNINKPKKLPAEMFPGESKCVTRYVHFCGKLLHDPDNTTYTIQHDMYAAGIMMYEMWTGHHAFQDKLEEGISLGEFIRFLKENSFQAFPLLRKERSLKEAQGWIDTLECCLFGSIDIPQKWQEKMEGHGQDSYDWDSRTRYKVVVDSLH